MDAVRAVKLKPKFAPAPEHLSASSAELWSKLVADYGLTGDDAALAILRSALTSRDRAEQARAILDRDGLVVEDRTGGQKAHPLLAVERDARAAWLSALKHLGLDLEPVHNRPGRPART